MLTAFRRHDDKLAGDGTAPVKALDFFVRLVEERSTCSVGDKRVRRLVEDEFAFEYVVEPAQTPRHHGSLQTHQPVCATHSYLFTGVRFQGNLEGRARPWSPRACSDTGPRGSYTRTRHIRIMYEALMAGHDRQPLHDLAVSRLR